MSVSVKSYLYSDSDDPEIRRFSVDQEVSANYTYLSQKIKSVYPRLLRKEIALFWKDKDEELITFSSDEELIDALGSVSGNVFKVYIREAAGKESKQKPDQDKEKVKFPGVVCDGCESNISGVRFKCLVCIDYDLCGTCEATGMHSEHDMLRMRTPGQRSPFDIGNMLRGAGLNIGPIGFPGRHHYPGRGHCRRGRGWAWGPFPAQGPRSGCPWMGQQAPPQPNGEQPAAAGAEQKQPNSDVPVGPPFLHSVGEAVASFLNPFGIEVHTYTDDDKVCCKGTCDHNCCPNKEKPCTTTTESSTSDEQPQDETPAETVKEPADAEACAPDATPADEECETPMEQEKTDESKSDHDFVLVDEKTDEEDCAPQTTSTSEKTNEEDCAPQTTSTSPTPQTTDPIEICMQQLQAMGFDTQGSWLKALVEVKSGDITQVLDTIHPMQ